jgi:sugar-specific transcriptional regulator TrmB
MGWPDDDPLRLRYELEAFQEQQTKLLNEVGDLRRENAKLAGMSGTERSCYLESLEEQLQRARTDAEKQQEELKRQIADGRSAYLKRMQTLETDLEKAVQRVLAAKEQAEQSEAESRRLEVIRSQLSREVAAAIYRAREDAGPLAVNLSIPLPGVNIEVSVPRLFKWLREKSQAFTKLVRLATNRRDRGAQERSSATIAKRN